MICIFLISFFFATHLEPDAGINIYKYLIKLLGNLCRGKTAENLNAKRKIEERDKKKQQHLYSVESKSNKHGKNGYKIRRNKMNELTIETRHSARVRETCIC